MRAGKQQQAPHLCSLPRQQLQLRLHLRFWLAWRCCWQTQGSWQSRLQHHGSCTVQRLSQKPEARAASAQQPTCQQVQACIRAQGWHVRLAACEAWQAALRDQ